MNRGQGFKRQLGQNWECVVRLKPKGANRFIFADLSSRAFIALRYDVKNNIKFLKAVFLYCCTEYPRLQVQYYSNGPGDLDNLGRKKEMWSQYPTVLKLYFFTELSRKDFSSFLCLSTVCVTQRGMPDYILVLEMYYTMFQIRQPYIDQAIQKGGPGAQKWFTEYQPYVGKRPQPPYDPQVKYHNFHMIHR